VLSCQGELGELLTTPTETSARRRRSDGERSRAAILDAATRLATVQGLDGLSIGRLAEHIGMSKSGLYAHFGSKEELQLATIDAAAEIFTREVIEPARAAEGAARLQALSDAFLSYLERRVFPGGCFFAAAQAELDTHPGPVREKLRETGHRWHGYLERQVYGAQEMGDLDPGEDPAQLAFEIDAMLKMATAVFVLHDDASALERARRGIETRVARAKIAA
jgi:AcrR family transcriptional regulator